MTKPPPENLKDWSKNNLVREVQRLRAILREHSSSTAPSHSGGDIHGFDPDPNAQGTNLIDMRGAVLLSDTEVVLIDRKSDTEPVAMALRLEGRINYSADRANTTYVMGPDGAAAIVTELIALAQRALNGGQKHGVDFAAEFRVAMDERMKALGG